MQPENHNQEHQAGNFSKKSVFVIQFLSLLTAVAASVAAIFSYQTQVASAINDVRPELVLERWERDAANIRGDTTVVGVIRNVGNGPALNLLTQVEGHGDQDNGSPSEFWPQVVAETGLIPFIASNERYDAELEITVNWERVKAYLKSEQPELPLTSAGFDLVLYYVDVEGRGYETTYKVEVYPIDIRPHWGAMATEVADNVYVIDRRTTKRTN